MNTSGSRSSGERSLGAISRNDRALPLDVIVFGPGASAGQVPPYVGAGAGIAAPGGGALVHSEEAVPPPVLSAPDESPTDPLVAPVVVASDAAPVPSDSAALDDP